MGEILIKNCFSPESRPHTAKLSFSVVLKYFWGNSQLTSLFSPKSDYLRKEHLNTQIFFVFFNVFKRLNPEVNLDMIKQFFLFKPVNGDKY